MVLISPLLCARQSSRRSYPGFLCLRSLSRRVDRSEMSIHCLLHVRERAVRHPAVSQESHGAARGREAGLELHSVGGVQLWCQLPVDLPWQTGTSKKSISCTTLESSPPVPSLFLFTSLGSPLFLAESTLLAEMLLLWGSPGQTLVSLPPVQIQSKLHWVKRSCSSHNPGYQEPSTGSLPGCSLWLL